MNTISADIVHTCDKKTLVARATHAGELLQSEIDTGDDLHGIYKTELSYCTDTVSCAWNACKLYQKSLSNANLRGLLGDFIHL